jgi:hypothetical protein
MPALLVVAFFCGPEKFCTLLDHAHRYGGSRTTFLHHQGIRRVSSPSDLKIIFCGTSILHDLFDLLVARC